MNILAIDHVQFALPDPMASAALLTRCGYALDFQEPDFNTETRSFYRGVAKSMAYLHRGTSRIEVITCTGIAGRTRYVPMFGGTACPDGLENLPNEKSLDGVIVRARHADRSAIFWQFLGFKPVMPDRFAFPPNMLSMPLNVSLDRNPPQQDADVMADDPGCASVALITRDIHADLAALDQAGYPASEATRFRINGRHVTICFVTGPSSELVELVEFGRT
ncbi:MAG: hypothetical protein QOF70_5491 [Acetobacteraceae bacterium]|jgi:hypothetical protein|nr:hypothetical protein [Rhodopila sp.]MEA2731016.1 hypothetical protein [Acetobacteraceae bacterium]